MDKKDKIEPGKKVRIHYTVTVDDKVAETTEGKPPLYYVHGKPMLLPAIQKKLEGHCEGDEVEFTLNPEEAYGVYDPEALQELPKSEMPENYELKIGMVLQEKQPDGSNKVGSVHEIKEDAVILNFNHPMAGMTLHYKIKVVNIMSGPDNPSAFPFVNDFPKDKPEEKL